MLLGTPVSLSGLCGQGFWPGKQGRRQDHQAPSDGREGQMPRTSPGWLSGHSEGLGDFLELCLSGYIQALLELPLSWNKTEMETLRD